MADGVEDSKMGKNPGSLGSYHRAGQWDTFIVHCTHSCTHECSVQDEANNYNRWKVMVLVSKSQSTVGVK